MHLLMPSLCRNLPAELLNLPAELLNPPWEQRMAAMKAIQLSELEEQTVCRREKEALEPFLANTLPRVSCSKPCPFLHLQYSAIQIFHIQFRRSLSNMSQFRLRMC